MQDVVWDESTPERLRGQGGARLIDALAGSFLEGAPERMSRVRASLGTGDLEALTREINNYRTTCLTLGALRMGALCRRMEERTRAASVDGVPDLLEELERAYVEVRPHVLAMHRAARPPTRANGVG